MIDRKDGTKQVTYNDIPLYTLPATRPLAMPRVRLWVASGGLWRLAINQITPGCRAGVPGRLAGCRASRRSGSGTGRRQRPRLRSRPARPGPAPAPKPAASPVALPRTGGVPFDPMPITAGFGAAGVSLTAVGAFLLRRRGQRK